ncbi:MAG: hypothetical protein RLN81_07495 [Balneolaceae bacterium]
MSTPYIITKSPKSTGIAILLTLLFGPIGLFYASVLGGFIMTFTPIALIGTSYYYLIYNVTEGNYAFFDWAADYFLDFYMIGVSLPIIYWLMNIIWAVIGVRNYNKRLEADAIKQTKYTF